MKRIFALLTVGLLTLSVNANEIQFENWKTFTKLGDIEVESRIGKIDGKVVEKQVRARNYFDTDMCVLSKIKNKINSKSELVNKGKVILSAGEEAFLGSYGAVRKGKHWKARWEFRATKNLKRCL